MRRKQARPLLLAITVVGIALLGTSPIVAADVKTGKRIATQWCASCHVISPTQKKASTDAPSFAAINRERRVSEIRAYLIQSHPQMPNMSLTQGEITNIITYMQSLAPPLDPLKQKPQKDKPPKTHRG